MGSGNSTNNRSIKTLLKLAQNYIENAKVTLSKDDIQYAIEEYDRAIDVLQEALKKDPQLTLAKNLLIQSYMDVASLYKQQKNFEKAELCYKEAKNLGSPEADLELKRLIRLISELSLHSSAPQIPAQINNDSDCNHILVITPSIKPDDEVKRKLHFIQNPANYKLIEYQGSYDDIQDTAELAGFLIQVDDDGLEYTELKKLALMVIEVFASKQVKTKESINEVTILATSENEEIITTLLGQFIQAIRDQVLLNEHLLNGLAEILRHANPSLLNSDDLTKVLLVIHEKLNSLHQQGSESKLLSLIQSIAKVLAAMADANVEGLNRIEQHEPLYDSLSALVGTFDSDFHCRQAALYARQSLVRVPNDETKLQSAIRRIIKIGQGLNSLNDAFQQKSPSELLNAFNSFKEAFKYQVRQKPWYDALRYAQLLIECNHFTGFEEFINKSEYYLQEGMLYGVVFLLKQTIETHINLDIRCSSLELLKHIWREQGQLEFRLRDQVREVFNQRTMFQDGEYVGLHQDILRCIAEIFLTSSRNFNQQIKQTAIKLIEGLKQTS
ncbi:MAG: tetratricopeptide repeat protein, partial [Gammaproteobacteria bacterium]